MTKDKDCIFCAISAGIIPAKKLFENETVFAIEDIHPAAPVHVLVIPKQHIVSLNDITDDTAHVVGALALMAQQVARAKNISSSGFRVVMNSERGAGQSVFHLHAHVLGGREFSWPPG